MLRFVLQVGRKEETRLDFPHLVKKDFICIFIFWVFFIFFRVFCFVLGGCFYFCLFIFVGLFLVFVGFQYSWSFSFWVLLGFWFSGIFGVLVLGWC